MKTIRFNKKGMLDYVLDVLVMVIVPLFGLLFLNLVLSQNISGRQQASVENIADFKRLDSAASHLLLQLQSGEAIEPSEIDQLIAQSKVLGGKTITSCQDYWNKEDCRQDIVGLHQDANGRCRWEEEFQHCIYYLPEAQSVRH